MINGKHVLRGDEQPIVTCRGGELSLITGVDLKTLRQYELRGLLKRKQPGYCHEDLIQIERIITMELLGFSVSEIRGGLSIERRLADELRIQMELWREKGRRLNHLIYFLEQAEQVNGAGCVRDWHHLGRVVAALRDFQDFHVCRSLYFGKKKSDATAAGADTLTA
jgi:DNA-binding transcriptional MerR regulator